MGSSDNFQNINGHGEDVDLDADTKESTDELFCNEETKECPHKITLCYKSDVAIPIKEHFPKNVIHKEIGKDATLGRHKDADVLLYDKHMARNFAAVTCRCNPGGKTSFVLKNTCNATKQKRISFTDTKGIPKDLLPNQEVELTEQMTFKLECVEFKIGIELGDINSKTFELLVRCEEDPTDHNKPGAAGSVAAGSLPALSSTFVGLPLNNSVRPSEQVIPKQVVTPLMHAAFTYDSNTSVPLAMPLQTNMGSNPAPNHSPHLGYVELQQPASYASHLQGIPPHTQGIPPPYSSYPGQYPHAPFVHAQHNQQHVMPLNYSQHAQQHVMPMNYSQHAQQHHKVQQGAQGVAQYLPQANFAPQGQGHPQDHGQNDSRNSGITMADLAQQFQQLANVQMSRHVPSSPGGIVTNPSSQDNSPVLYPSPANPRFRFPQPPTPRVVQPVQPSSPGLNGMNLDLSRLPRGPPLGSLGQQHQQQQQDENESIDLHPSPRHEQRKDPVEHEDKPK